MRWKPPPAFPPNTRRHQRSPTKICNLAWAEFKPHLHGNPNWSAFTRWATGNTSRRNNNRSSEMKVPAVLAVCSSPPVVWRWACPGLRSRKQAPVSSSQHGRTQWAGWSVRSGRRVPGQCPPSEQSRPPKYWSGRRSWNLQEISPMSANVCLISICSMKQVCKGLPITCFYNSHLEIPSPSSNISLLLL